MRILKTDIPVDSDWADYEMGDIVHVAHQSFGNITVWWWDCVSGQKLTTLPTRRLRAYATGEPVPVFDAKRDHLLSPHHVGTAVDVGSKLVWHLIEDVLELEPRR